MNTIFVFLTGEDWNLMMRMVSMQTGSYGFVTFWFIFVYMLGHCFLLNMFLAVIVKSYTENTNEEDAYESFKDEENSSSEKDKSDNH